MGTEALIIFLVCGIILMLIILGSWYRRRKQARKELEEPESISRIHETIVNGQRTFRIATVSRHGDQLNMDVYEIRLPRPSDTSGTASIRLLPPLTRLHNRSNYPPPVPPPQYQYAINMASPNRDETVISSSESPVPPPGYDEAIAVSTISGTKVSESETSSVPTTEMQRQQLQQV
ncbi:hypothetical protein Ocin01_05746 [Orchesella cincta]|uniref:Uncharacterized protein n=1 Tax=Orchesella cincta TaxID=48709 RepID=A0A1D2N6R3_ORCCI|nr:hypothetical protein Ocin01_05746 [Orchesella cincta]